VKRVLLGFVVFAALCATGVLAQQTIAIAGKQVRGVPGRDAQLISTGVMLPRNGTIVQAVCGGDGFWIEDDMGVVMEYPDWRKAIGMPLDAGGPYRVYPFLKNDQSETSVHITVNMP
jgi:hypothetical protein